MSNNEWITDWQILVWETAMNGFAADQRIGEMHVQVGKFWGTLSKT